MLIRNGKPVDEPYVQHLSGALDEYRDQFPINPASFPLEAAGRMLLENVQNGELVVPRETISRWVTIGIIRWIAGIGDLCRRIILLDVQ